MTESHAIGLWKIKTQTAQINSAVCLFQSWFWLNYTASQHGSSQRLRCLIWTYRNLWGCFRGGVFPYIGRIHSAYIGGDSSILGTCLVTKRKPPSLPMKICQQIIHHSGLRFGVLCWTGILRKIQTLGKFSMIFLDLLVGCLEKVRNIIKQHDPQMVFF